MGYAVLHLDKALGNDAPMSAHIERTIEPKNADPTRTHLNRELIEFPDGVPNRTHAIQHRLDTAGLTRKIGINQVRAIRVLLSGSPEDMKRIEAEGKLGDWCAENLEWLRKTYGAGNVVSAVLHMDENTPHIHATVVPIVCGERRKAKAADPDKRKYRKKKSDVPRLCADDVMARPKLTEYQDSYAEVMNKYGLGRGIKGSEARHITTQQFYRDAMANKESIQQDISALLQMRDAQQQETDRLKYHTDQALAASQQASAQQEQAIADQKQAESKRDEALQSLKQVKGQLMAEKFKSTAAEVGLAMADGLGSLFSDSKTQQRQAELRTLRNENKDLTDRSESLSEQVYRLKSDITHLKKEHETVMDKLQQELKIIYDRFPKVREVLKIENLCRHLGFSENLIQRIMGMKPVAFKGKLYSAEYKRHFETEHSVAVVELHPTSTEPEKLRLTIDGVSDTTWFRQKHKEELLDMGINVKMESQQSKGIKM